MSTTRYALKYDDCIVAVAGFALVNENKYRLDRFCQVLNTTVCGGLHKLLAQSVADHKPFEVTALLDNQYSSEDDYAECGFIKTKVVKPNYRYVDCAKRKGSRFKIFSKSHFSGIKEVDVFKSGYRKIWDAGKTKMELRMSEWTII
jgi:hypothetical protein